MVEHPENQPSGADAAAENNFAPAEVTKKFLQDLFAEGNHFEDRFRKICDSGFYPDMFATLLHATCVLMSGKSMPLLHSGRLSKSQLRGLPKRLRDIAALIGALNASPMAPSNEVYFMPYVAEGMAVREHLVQRYKMLPGMLYVYAEHIERFSKIARTTFKRLTTEHLLAIAMVCIVEHSTGSPQCSDLSELLEQGCRIAGGGKTIVPRFLTADGLAKLYKRWGDAVLGSRK